MPGRSSRRPERDGCVTARMHMATHSTTTTGPQLGGDAATSAVPRLRWRFLFGGCVLGLLLAVLCEAGRVLLGSNFHIVLPGRVYRCAQLSDERLEQIVQAHGIRTVVNLRGTCTPLPWYLDESRATHRLNVSQEDVC